MYIPSAEMGSYDSWKPPPQKKMSSKQLLEAKYGGGGGSLERQGSRSKMTGLDRTSSRGRMDMNDGARNKVASRQDSRSKLDRQDSRPRMMERQDSRSRMERIDSKSRMIMERQNSRNHMISRQPSSKQLASHDHGCSSGDGHHDHHHDDGHVHVHGGHTDVEMQIRMMASSGKLQDSNGRQRSKPRPSNTNDSPRDTYQGSRGKGWQNSLRGSGGYVDPPRRSEPRRPSSGQVQRHDSGRRSNGQCQEHCQPRDMRRRSRSQSRSPSGRLFSSTYSSRAKTSEPTISEDGPTRGRSNSRVSKSPQRSRANSTSGGNPVRRRSKSKTPGNNLNNRRSVGNFGDIANNYDDDDGIDEGPDPFLAYKSFQQFKETQGGYSNGYSNSQVNSSVRRSQISSSDDVKKLSSSFSSARISDTYTANSSNGDSFLESFDYKPFSSAKLADSRNKPGLGESGIFSSTPKSSDFGNNSSMSSISNGSSSLLSRTTSSSMFSTADSGYSGYSGVSKRSSGAFSGLDSSFSSSRTSPESLTMSDKFKSSGKISLGALKRPSVDTWESNNSAILRRGASSTYIG